MTGKLRRVLIAARFNAPRPGPPTPEEIHAIRLAWEAALRSLADPAFASGLPPDQSAGAARHVRVRVKKSPIRTPTGGEPHADDTGHGAVPVQAPTHH